ncbi:MAG: PfkB family carbohydrate kinase [Nocardioidaceae bacterium]
MTAGLVCVGDNVVDVYVDEGFMYPGGNALNVAVHATRIGATPAAYVGALGTDHAGKVVLAALEAEGVDTGRTRVVDGPNAFATVRLVAGDRVFSQGGVGVSRFTPDAGDLALAAAARVVHTGECSMMEPHLDALSAAARFLSFDFSERDWDYVEAHAPHADLAILSRPERSSDDPLEVAARVLELGPTQVVVSSGAKGALWADRTRHLHAAAPDARVVDTLGAGDSLIARLLVGIVEGETPDVWLPAATAYATAACMERGAFGHAASLTPNAPPSNTSERQE